MTTQLSVSMRIACGMRVTIKERLHHWVLWCTHDSYRRFHARHCTNVMPINDVLPGDKPLPRGILRRVM